MTQFKEGDRVRLVEIDGDPISEAEQLRGIVSRGISKNGEIEVTFPTQDGRGGFDFWPANECRLDTDTSEIVPINPRVEKDAILAHKKKVVPINSRLTPGQRVVAPSEPGITGTVECIDYAMGWVVVKWDDGVLIEYYIHEVRAV